MQAGQFLLLGGSDFLWISFVGIHYLLTKALLLAHVVWIEMKMEIWKFKLKVELNPILLGIWLKGVETFLI